MNNMMGGFNQPPSQAAGSTGLPQNMAESAGATEGDGGMSGERNENDDAAGKHQD